MEKKKRIYVAPAMQVVELKGRQMLLAGSTPSGGIQSMNQQTLFDDDLEEE